MWILDNLWIFLAAALAGVITLIVYRMIQNKKTGKASCGCGCAGCAMRDKCHPKEDQ